MPHATACHGIGRGFLIHPALSHPLTTAEVGILLKLMQSNEDLEGATHIIIDEVHERDLHTDFLLTLIRRVLVHRPNLRVILMSACKS